MSYTIIATDANGIRVEIANNETKLSFQNYEEANYFIHRIKESNFLPEKYKFVIEEI